MHLDEFDRVDGPQTLTWLPVRHTLDVRAFGTNAYVAGAAGDDVVEEHDKLAEPGQDPHALHQELYFVARGHADVHDRRLRARCAGGDLRVHLRSPTSRRHAVTREPGTTPVLSFGGPPTFRPSSWEAAWLSAPRMRADPEEARRLLREGLDREPDSPELIYNMACLEALQSNPDEALRWLRHSRSNARRGSESGRVRTTISSRCIRTLGSSS